MTKHVPWDDLTPEIKAPFLKKARESIAGLIIAESPVSRWSNGFEMDIDASWAEDSEDAVEAVAEDFYNMAVAFCEDGNKPF